MPSIQPIKALFHQQLADYFPEREINSLFKLAAEKVLELNSHQLLVLENISDEKAKDLELILLELKKGRPLQYILEQAWFYDLPLYVNESVLIPRQETEELVHWILEEWKNKNIDPLTILDIGTGSGCIPLALKANLPQTHIYGLDVSKEALEVAQKNSEQFQLKVEFLQQDILTQDEWHGPPLDVIVSNPPYIPPEESQLMSDHVLKHEPHLALFTPEGAALIFYERIGRFAQKHLKPGGQLYFEINEFNSADVCELLERQNFSEVLVKKDLSGKERMVRAIL